jgi:signal transduction histidine kinase
VVPSIKLLYIVLILCSAAVVIAGIAIHLQLKRHAKASDEALHRVFDGIEDEQQANK